MTVDNHSQQMLTPGAYSIPTSGQRLDKMDKLARIRAERAAREEREAAEQARRRATPSEKESLIESLISSALGGGTEIKKNS